MKTMECASTEAIVNKSARRAVLVADDEESVRNVLNLALQKAGFRVWTAADGQEALELYRRRKGKFDVVLLDVRMPHLDGVQAWIAMQALNGGVHGCFMSGNLHIYPEAMLRGLGAAAVFPKPFRLSELVQTLIRIAEGNGVDYCASGSREPKSLGYDESGGRNGRNFPGERPTPP